VIVLQAISRPPFSTSRVGIERRSNPAAVRGLSSTLSFTTRMRPALHLPQTGARPSAILSPGTRLVAPQAAQTTISPSITTKRRPRGRG
jgi:hypothetical protein